MLRLGFFTSPAVKVMLFHASDENSDPTCTTARITTRFTGTMGPPMPSSTGCRELHPAFLQNCAPKFAAHAVALRPTVKASRTSAASDSAFTEVNTFWISAPSRMPKQFTMARKTATRIAVRLAVLTPISIFPSTIGPTLSGGT